MINNRFNVVYHLLCVGVWVIKVECLIGEPNKKFKRKRRWKNKIGYLYIKENDERFETIY